VIEGSLELGFGARTTVSTISIVQRLFSMFPPGAPGIGLLVLRISVAAIFVLIAANRTDMSSIHPLFVGALLVTLCVAIGFLTPYLSFIVCVFALVILFGASAHSDILLMASLLLSSAALGLLGPGAYSIDARLFGRRVVVVPPRRDRDRI
jgi:uncharacterized membrane protein YphA (DoxX/SURF4 family)